MKSLLDISSLINLITNSFFIPPVPAPIDGKAIELNFLFKQSVQAFFVDSQVDSFVATPKTLIPVTWIMPMKFNLTAEVKNRSRFH